MKHLPYIKYQNIYVIPTFHSRIEFAKLVRKSFFKVYPDIIAVELPDNIREEVMEGIERLPFLSLIAYADSLDPKTLNFIPIDPGDSIIEAIRIGINYNIPVEFIDLSVENYTPPIFKLPDDYSMIKMGLVDFYDKVSDYINKVYRNGEISLRDNVKLNDLLSNEPDEVQNGDYLVKDLLREKYMAKHLKKLMQSYHRVLFVSGLAHWNNIKYYLENSEMLEDVEPDLVPHEYVKIYNVESRDARFLLRELPFNTYKWIKFKENYSKEVLENVGAESPSKLFKILDSYDKKEHIRKIFLNAKYKYEEEFKEFVDLHKLKSLFQYSRNLSITEGRLLPSLNHFLISAKNVVDDDYAWKVYDEATKYPFNDVSERYETMKLSVEGGYDPNGRYIKLRRRHAYQYGGSDELPIKKRPEEEYEGHWKEEWEDAKFRTVSYPPEDIIEEDYFAYIRHKAIKNLKNKRVQIEEFKSSLLDGLAIKETIRNWAFKKKIYVRNEQQIKGKVDTLIVIFDIDDGSVEKYPYKLTWWAEHDKESDLVFYSTNPGEYLIGPGISHVEIGGLLSIFPPQGIRDVFGYMMRGEFQDTNNKAERLLKAGILFSKEHYIVYVAKKQPRKYFSFLAGLKNREIIYIPINNFSKDSIKTIKHLHILAGKDKRRIAHNYIFLE
ncbi:MAG: hypothetical protein GF383_14415 [Candidatus Lokiarchaeota archaeon]|nr:hypothetical protein [Candidatus Lokiarchaeota archaeon]MBD3342584.1 hypothetical protein [Candidatus Lokiarchaeota archaeon]